MFNSIKVKNDICLNYNELILDFFVKDTKEETKRDKRVYLIFGRNGSGKTHLSRSLKKYDFKNFNQDVIFLDYHHSHVEIYEKSHIFVYNEDYINENFIFADDNNLNAIVMTGEIKELEVEIKELIDKKERNINNIEDITEYNNSKIKYYNEQKEKLENLLRGKGRWAEKDSKIRNKESKRNSAVNEKTLLLFKPYFEVNKKILFDENTNLRDEYSVILERMLKDNLVEMEKLKEQLKKARNEKKIDKISLDYEYYSNCEEEISYILLDKLDYKGHMDFSNSLSEKITDEYKKIGKEELSKSLKKLEDQKDLENPENPENQYCPTCFKNFDSRYFSKIEKTISTLIEEETKDNDIKKFKDKINSSKLDKVDISLLILDENIKEYFTSSYEKLKLSIDLFNHRIDEYNIELENKKNKLYKPVKITKGVGRLTELFQKISLAVDTLNKEINAHNLALENIEEITKKSISNNNENSFITLFNELNEYYILEKEIKKIKKEEDNLDSDIKLLEKQNGNIEEKISNLKATRSQINIAVDEINEKLDYILYNKGFLKIEPDNGKYYVLVNNKRINLKKLSTGQRNLISLCYFFTQINENKALKNKYKDELLLVLDDPISSFDQSNRLGIMSLLRYELGEILLSNPNSKVIILTHDTGVMFDLEKIISDINEERKLNERYSKIPDISYIRKELTNNKAPLRSYNPGKSYSNLMTQVYNFADGKVCEEHPSSLSIGNNTRRILEAFSTFNFNNGITYLSNNEEVLGLLEDEYLQKYYKNFMSRLVLNSESHLKEKTQAILGANNMPTYSYEEKKRVARDTISFLYLINLLHVKNNINNYSEKIEDNICQWIPDNKDKETFK